MRGLQKLIGYGDNASTQRRAEEALAESEQRFRGLLDAAAIGFALVQLDGRFSVVNRSLCEMLGYAEAELLELDLRQITHPDDIDTDAALVERLSTGGLDRFQLEKRYVSKSGQTVWAVLAMSLVRDTNGEPSYAVAQITEITARKQAEQELAERAARLERSNAELEQFASVASHDLQEPLRTVANYAQLLAERYRDQLDQRAHRWINYMVNGVERMQRLIEGVLALARVRTDTVAFVPTDPNVIVARNWDQLVQFHREVEAQLTVDALPMIVADPGQIDQLFQNLLSNAFKYRRIDGPLQVHISATRTTHDGYPAWEFMVRDNGIGLDMAYAERIFELFQRLHRDEHYVGTGIGLAICQKIVEHHRGRIWVDAAPNQGAAFRFTIAAIQASPEPVR